MVRAAGRLSSGIRSYARRAGQANQPQQGSQKGVSLQDGNSNAVAERKDPWVEVRDKASGGAYWWNQATNETTAVGAPRPMPGAPVLPFQTQGQAAMGAAGQFGTLVMMGAGMSIGFAMMRMVFG